MEPVTASATIVLSAMLADLEEPVSVSAARPTINASRGHGDGPTDTGATRDATV
jgi:hypothetical protein